MSLIQWILAVAGIIGPLVILLIMHARKLRSKFPLFFSYMIFYVLISGIGLAAYFYTCEAYSYIIFVLTVLMIGMEFGVIYEVLTYTLRPFSALTDLAKVMFRWAAIFLLLSAVVTALATNGPQVTKLLAAMTVVEHTIRIAECGLLLFLLVFETHLGIHWRSHGLSIAIGLGIYSAVDLTISYLRIRMPASIAVLDTTEGLVYIGALTFWSCMLMLPEPARKSLLESPTRLIFQRWNEALMATPLVSRKNQIAVSPIQSFLPGVEQTVERVMARKMMH